jgi:hypothetical protein
MSKHNKGKEVFFNDMSMVILMTITFIKVSLDKTTLGYINYHKLNNCNMKFQFVIVIFFIEGQIEIIIYSKKLIIFLTKMIEMVILCGNINFVLKIIILYLCIHNLIIITIIFFLHHSKVALGLLNLQWVIMMTS